MEQQEQTRMLVTLTIGEIVDVIRKIVSECLETSRQPDETETAENGEKLVTTAKAMRLLNCNRSTLWRWNRDKYLCTVKVGKKNFYKLLDINNIINGK